MATKKPLGKEDRTKIGDTRYKTGKTPAGNDYYAGSNKKTGASFAEVTTKKARYTKEQSGSGYKTKSIENVNNENKAAMSNKGFKKAVSNWNKRGGKMPKGK